MSILRFSLIRRLDDDIQEAWPVTRQRGFQRFVLVNGTILGACFAAAYLGGTCLDGYALALEHAAAALVISVMLGWLVGALVWRRHEDCYRRLLGQRASNSPE
jgi:hypothetical protein